MRKEILVQVLSTHCRCVRWHDPRLRVCAYFSQQSQVVIMCSNYFMESCCVVKLPKTGFGLRVGYSASLCVCENAVGVCVPLSEDYNPYTPVTTTRLLFSCELSQSEITVFEHYVF